MPRYRARVDANQPSIVEAARAVGATVQHLHTVGQGCPDILIGINGFNLLVEIKDGSRPPSERRLTPDEQEWHDSWRGQKAIVENEQEVIDLIQEWRHREAW